MARLARVTVPGTPHHVTQRGNPRQETFFGEEDYQHYLELMSQFCRAEQVAIAGKASPQAVFPAHPGEWGLVRTDSIPRGSLQEAMIDPSIVSSEHARHARHPLATGGQGGPAVLDDCRLVGGDLGLKRFLVGLKCLEIRLNLGARRLEALPGNVTRGNATGSNASRSAGEREAGTRATGTARTAGERQTVTRPVCTLRAFRVQRVYVGSGIGSFTGGSIPSCESLRRCPCGVQELPPFQHLARRSTPDLRSRSLCTRSVDSVEGLQQCLHRFHRIDSILPRIAVHPRGLMGILPHQRSGRVKAHLNITRNREIMRTWEFHRRRALDSVSKSSTARTRGLNQNGETGPRWRKKKDGIVVRLDRLGR